MVWLAANWKKLLGGCLTCGCLVLIAIFVVSCTGVAAYVFWPRGQAQPPVVQQPPTPQPVAPVVQQPTAAPAVPTVVSAAQVCVSFTDYALVRDMEEVATHGDTGYFLHVEFYTADGQPEYETLLPAGRYALAQPLRGHVWEYRGCTAAQVMQQIQAHIARRLGEHANNKGFVDANSTGLFRRVGP